LKITPYNIKRSISENEAPKFNMSQFNIAQQKQDDFNVPESHLMYQQVYKCPIYSKERRQDTFEQHCKSVNSYRGSLPDPSIFLGPRRKIIFLKGSALCKSVNWQQRKNYRLITNNQFYFNKKMFQTWIAQLINLSLDKFIRLSKNWTALMISQQQSLTFKFFLPPK